MRTEEQKAKNRIYMRNWTLANPEKSRARGRAAYRRFISDPEKKSALWKKQNQRSKTPIYKEKKLVRERARRKQRYAFDVNYCITQRLRARLTAGLKGLSKAAKTLALVGCTIEQLKAHIESSFRPGMSWDNRRMWHLDHIIPCSRFDLRDAEQQKKCFHFTNLQPLWAIENITKSDGGFWRTKKP